MRPLFEYPLSIWSQSPLGFSFLSLQLSQGQNSHGSPVAHLLTFLHLNWNPHPSFPCHCIMEVTSSERVRNYRMLSPNSIVSLLSPDLLANAFVTVSLLYLTILVYLPESPSFLPLIFLSRWQFYFNHFFNWRSSETWMELLLSFCGELGQVIIWSLMEAHHSLWSLTFHHSYIPRVSHCEWKKYHGASTAMSSRNVYKGKIMKKSQVCHLDNTVDICAWNILVLDKIGDSLLELAKQTKHFGNRRGPPPL